MTNQCELSFLKVYIFCSVKSCHLTILVCLVQKAVLSVLAEASGGKHLHRPEKISKEKNPISLSDAVMKRCRMVLRRALSADEGKVFCNLLGSPMANVNDNEDEGILGFPAMVSRPLDFRTIDLRLAFGAYGTSHEAFLEDVREV